MGIARSRRLKAIVVLAGALYFCFCRADEIVDRGKALMAQGKAIEAFALLEPLEDQRAGDIDFDYVLGTSALDSGRPDRAVIAFERILAVDPKFAGARLDLARAYFAMGNDELAKNEFEIVQQQSPPENVKVIIARYLEAIDARRKKEQPATTGYVEAGAGTDNNVSAVTTGFTGGVLQAYGIPNVQPTGNSVLRKGSFTQDAAGVNYTRPVEFRSVQGLGIYAGGDLRERHYYGSANPFTYQQYDGRGGISYLPRDSDQLRLGVQAQRYYQTGATPPAADGTAITNDRFTFGYTAEWRHAFGPGRQLSLFTQRNQQRFSTNAPQNINQNLYGGQFLNVWDAKWNPLVMVAFYQSRDRAIGPSNLAQTTDISKTLTGLRLLGQVTFLGKLDLFLSLGHTERKDNSQFSRSLFQPGGNNIPYGKDRTFDASLGAVWRFVPKWSLRAQVTSYDNRSNLSLYDYKRTEASAVVRRDFM